jgi:hypothetical protein
VPRGSALVGKASAPDMYAAVDLAEQKLAMQVRRAKERREDHHRGRRPTPAKEGAPPAPEGDETLTYEDVTERLRRGD